MPINSFLYPAPSTPSFVYNVANSLRFDDGSSDNLTRTQDTADSRRKFTISHWVKKTTTSVRGMTLHSYNSGEYLFADFESSNLFEFYSQTGATINFNLKTNRVFRDVSAWVHVVIAVDTTQSTSSDRIKIYFNGTQETSFATAVYPSLNHDCEIGTSSHLWNIGSYADGGNYFNGYLAEYVLIDNQALDPTSFGEFDSDSPNIWKPIDVSGLTFGTNGFYLDFENASSLGADVSGNSNNFTLDNLTSVDQSTDTCTNNFATMNSLIPNSNITYSEGNLRVQQDSVGNNRISLSTIAVSAGKWYVEHKISQHQDHTHTGIVAADSTYSTSNSLAQMENAYAYKNDGTVQQYNQSNIDTGEATYTAGDIIGIALDMDNNKLYFHKNGTYLNSGDPAGNSNGYSITSGKEYYFAKAQNYAKYTDWNFGSPSFSISSGNADDNGYGNFEYDVPAGFYALNTKNLAEFG